MIRIIQDALDKKLLEATTPREKEKLETIKKILEEDTCFFKIDCDTAFSILRDLGFSKEESKEIYKELISSKYYNKKEAWS